MKTQFQHPNSENNQAVSKKTTSGGCAHPLNRLPEASRKKPLLFWRQAVSAGGTEGVHESRGSRFYPPVLKCSWDLEPQVAPDKQDTTVLANNILWVGEQVNLWRTLTVKVEIAFLIAVHLTLALKTDDNNRIIITITWSTSPESHWSVHIHFKMIKMWRERIWWTTHSRFWN